MSASPAPLVSHHWSLATTSCSSHLVAAKSARCVASRPGIHAGIQPVTPGGSKEAGLVAVVSMSERQ